MPSLPFPTILLSHPIQSRSQMSRKQRQLGASLGLLSLTHSADEDDEVMDERCYFPVTAVDLVLRKDYMVRHIAPPLISQDHMY